jgi:lipoprotein-releasing system ATP-binding protein
MSNPTLLELKNISKQYGKLEILKGVNLKIQRGQSVAIIGESGSGKSTLLHIAGLLDTPTKGELLLNDKAIDKRDWVRTKLRRQSLGFIYQQHHLQRELKAWENVAVAGWIQGLESKEEAHNLLTQMGLAERAEHYPSQLSGGEKQRVAIARALLTQPDLLLADEPTGNLDPQTSNQVFDLLLTEVQSRQMALLLVTHNHDLAKQCDAVYELKAGVLKKG